MSAHRGFGYTGGGVYACFCGEPLAVDYPGLVPAAGADRIADLKVAHLAHRLEVEPEALLEEVD